MTGSRVKVPAACLATNMILNETFPCDLALLFFKTIKCLFFFTTDLSDEHWDKIEKDWAEPEHDVD